MIWRTLRQLLSSRPHAWPGPVAESPPTCPGEYQSLHVYLRSRFAGRVVLTFSEIEDLVGFPLPSQARVDAAWWSTAGLPAGGSLPAAAWTLTNRVAAVNLSARNVVFDLRD
jgi:hypothetical protein